MRLFVTGIGTGVGKTVASAMLVRQFDAAYWKPIQSGAPTDSDEIRRLLGPDVEILPEQYCLSHPASPHESAALEGLEIRIETIIDRHLPERCIIEGAGGLLVPINNNETMADLIKAMKVPVVLVMRYYLGCINHTLLSLAYCQQNEIEVAGLIMNGEPNPYSREAILRQTDVPVFMEIPEIQPN